MKESTYVRFTSHLGISVVAPSDWTPADEGDTFSLNSPDGHAAIHVITFTSEGSGTLISFRETMAAGLLPKDATGWEPSDWETTALGEAAAQKRELVPIPASDEQWQLYAVDGGRYYYAIILNASSVAMTLNGDFYENIVRTFEATK